jgi:hypothetical protein
MRAVRRLLCIMLEGLPHPGEKPLPDAERRALPQQRVLA